MTESEALALATHRHYKGGLYRYIDTARHSETEESMVVYEHLWPHARGLWVRPADLFFHEAKRRNIAVIARVPLASGLLSGKIPGETAFAADDHRNFNRNGEAFDVGETFAGVPFEVGLLAVEEVRKLVPAGAGMAAFALRWILMNEAVTVVIPGARNAEQAKANAAASDLAPLSADVMAATRDIYDRLIAPHVHQRW